MIQIKENFCVMVKDIIIKLLLQNTPQWTTLVHRFLQEVYIATLSLPNGEKFDLEKQIKGPLWKMRLHTAGRPCHALVVITLAPAKVHPPAHQWHNHNA